MDIVLNLGLFIVSLAVLLKAADWFIDSAEGNWPVFRDFSFYHWRYDHCFWYFTARTGDFTG